ncbi:MAG TPA: sugar transferase [Verrucomicrobiae bacterium]|nr:sugar transferase [Verrucomicrobiae bacterium]
MKRFCDVILSAIGLLVLSPLLLLIAAVIKLADGGSIFYRQCRVGWRGHPFLICKFRTMVVQTTSDGPLVTSDGDARVTRVGRILRKTKLDELPQLWNVLKGEMSLVGPRPEVPRYVQRYSPAQRAILKVRPGITDLASIHFRNEELLLKNAPNVEEFYIEYCLPRKLQLNLEYAARANLLTDTWIILQTICPRWLGVLIVYSLVLAASFWFSCLLVLNSEWPPRMDRAFFGALIAVVAGQVAALLWRKQYRGLLGYFSMPELKEVAAALGVACLLLLALSGLTGRTWPPRNLLLEDWIVSVCAVSGFRLLLRHRRENASLGETTLGNAPVRVGIIGAGAAGSHLALELMFKRQFGRSVVAFFDDDVQKWHKLLHNIPVIGMPECLLEGWAGKLDEVIIAMPEEPVERLREIGRLIRQAGLRAYMAPSVHRLWFLDHFSAESRL